MRDPQLNSAECITEGHQPSISSVTEHSWRIRLILILSSLFSIVFGPLLAFTTTRKQDELGKKDNNRKNTVDFLCVFLFVIITVLIIPRYVTVHTSSSDKKMVPYYMFLIIELIQPAIVLAGVIVFLVTWVKCGGSDQNNYSVKVKSLLFIICANLATYHFCWLLVGIMLNPIWGLVALLVLCLFIGISTFAFYNYMSSNDAFKCQSFSSCFGRFLAVCGLIVTVILAGQSYNGRQTADEALKKAVMYLISISFSWLYWKGWVNKSKKSADCPSGLVLAPNSSHENCHAPEQSGTEMETLVRQDVQIISV